MKFTLGMILEARERLKGVAQRTGLVQFKALSDEHSQIYLKTEDLQNTGSFKVRGAYIKIASLSEEERACGVIASSAGNHAPVSYTHLLPQREGFAHRFVAGKMGEQTQFDLRVIRIDEYAACRGDERAADFAPHRRAHGDILQIRLAGRNAPRRGDGLIEPCVNAAVAARQPEQAVDIGALELGNLTIEQNFIHDRVKLGQLV